MIAMPPGSGTTITENWVTRPTIGPSPANVAFAATVLTVTGDEKRE